MLIMIIEYSRCYVNHIYCSAHVQIRKKNPFMFNTKLKFMLSKDKQMYVYLIILSTEYN